MSKKLAILPLIFLLVSLFSTMAFAYTGENFFPTLYDTNVGVDGASAIFQMTNPTSSIATNFNVSYVRVEGDGIENLKYYNWIWQTLSKNVTDYSENCRDATQEELDCSNSPTCYNIINETKICELEVCGWHFENYTQGYWNEFNHTTFTLQPSQTEKIKIVATWDINIWGISIDWIPEIKVDGTIYKRMDWDWWNSTSFPYSRPIINNITSEWTVSVNDTGLVKGKVLWASIKNESRVISSGAGSTGLISIANTTNQKFFEWENNLSGYSPTSLWTNNFVVYHFGEASGTQSADSTWSRNLTMTSGALGNTTGIYGNAFFSGGSGCGYTNASLDMSGTHEMTVTYWIKFWDTSSVYHGFIENENTANGFYMALPCDGANQCQGEFLMKSTSGNVWVSTGLPSTNLMDTWYFVACAYDRSASTSDTQLRCFINNTKYTTSGSMTPNTNSLANSVLYIGGRTCSGLFSTFLMDEFRIYKTSLTDAEILNIYNNGRNNLTRLGTEEQPAPYISITFNYSSVSFTNMSSPSANNSAPNQLNGIYNVTVDTNANYKIEANGTNLVKGGDSIAISNLRIDTNSTKTDIAVGSSVSLSTSTQTIDNNIPFTNTADYHGYWLTIPEKQPAGTYSTTVKIIYSNV